MPFIKCPSCGKTCSTKLRTCPKCMSRLEPEPIFPSQPIIPQPEAVPQPMAQQMPQPAMPQPAMPQSAMPQPAPVYAPPTPATPLPPTPPPYNPAQFYNPTPAPGFPPPYTPHSATNTGAPSSATIQCPICGCTVAAGTAVCPSCNMRLPSLPTPPNPYQR